MKSESLSSLFHTLPRRRLSPARREEDAIPPRASAFAADAALPPPPPARSRTLRQRAFTLAELVVVMGVMTILTGITVPAVRGLTSSSALDTGVRRFADLLHLARSEAIAQHTIVRFALATQWPGQDDAPLRKASLWSWDPEAQQYFQTTSWETLPAGVIVETSVPGYVARSSYANNDKSSIRGDCFLDPNFALQNEFTPTSTGSAVTMQFIQFLPTGAAQIPGGSLRNVILVMTPGFQNSGGSMTYTTQANGQPTNWAQLNVDTLTGRVRVYQP